MIIVRLMKREYYLSVWKDQKTIDVIQSFFPDYVHEEYSELIRDVLTLQEASILSSALHEIGVGSNIEIIRDLNVEVPNLNNFSVALDAIRTSLETATMLNQACNVGAGGTSLLGINQLMLLENACTDAVQHLLKQGWRIVSALVQPNQRRPDYVLGKRLSDDETTHNALR